MNSEPTMQKCVTEEMKTFSLMSKKARNGRMRKGPKKVFRRKKYCQQISHCALDWKQAAAGLQAVGGVQRGELGSGGN